MKFTLSFIISFYLTISYSQTYSDETTNKEISEFFNELNKSKKQRIKKIDREIIKWRDEQIYGQKDTTLIFSDSGKGLLKSDTLNKYLSKNDLNYIKKQYLSLKNTNWNATEFRNFQLIDSTGLKEILDYSLKRKKKIKNYYSYSYSMPFFSIDKKYAIFIEEYYCGFMCSQRCFNLYYKENESENWKEIAEWDCLAS